MGRKSKKLTSGHMPLTHHERSKKFASSEYGTVSKRVSSDSQYKLGDCGLGLSSLYRQDVLCTPSGFLYAADAILAYLLQHTQALKKQRNAWEAQQSQLANKDDEQKAEAKRSFEESQKLLPTAKRPKTAHEQASADLKRTSYWLADAQPAAVAPAPVAEPPSRPPSPHSGEGLRRKDLWPVELDWSGDDEDDAKQMNAKSRPLCSVSHKVLHSQAAVAYWTTSKPSKDQPGRVVLQDVYDQMVAGTCPHTGRKVKATRVLQRSGTSFSASAQAVETRRYRPTIT